MQGHQHTEEVLLRVSRFVEITLTYWTCCFLAGDGEVEARYEKMNRFWWD